MFPIKPKEKKMKKIFFSVRVGEFDGGLGKMFGGKNKVIGKICEEKIRFRKKKICHSKGKNKAVLKKSNR